MVSGRLRPGGRGQAYTLEGVIGGIVLLTAILVVLQSIVVTPGAGGGLTADEREDLRVQAEDAMVTIAEDDDFSWSTAIRFWEQSNRSFVGAVNEEVGYGSRAPPGTVGTVLNETFLARGYQYGVELRYLRPTNESRVDPGPGNLSYAYRGEPSGESVTVSYHVTLYDNQTLSAPGSTSSGVELWRIDSNATDGDDGYYPIPNAADAPVYNVVEVRLTVW
jgi:hypothetical protein